MTDRRSERSVDTGAVTGTPEFSSSEFRGAATPGFTGTATAGFADAGLGALAPDLPGVPEATVARLAVYLRVLTSLADRGVRTASSDDLAVLTDVGSAVIRRDLSHLGPTGTRGVGYDVGSLVDRVSHMLGLTHERAVVIVGVGNLGSALAGYAGFGSRGFSVRALVDCDPVVVGSRVRGLQVEALEDLEAVVARTRAVIGVIATPGPAAQKVCDRLVRAGIRSILSFAPAVLRVEESVDVRRVDLSVELAILAFHEQRKAPAAALASATGGAL